jgi:hypothetical protein
MVNEKTNEMSVLLTLIVPRNLADSLADELMQIEAVSGFTQDEVLGFTKRPQAMNTAEQVAGRQQMSRFELLILAEEAPLVLAVLSQHKVGSQTHFSIMPVHRHQHGMVFTNSNEAAQ